MVELRRYSFGLAVLCAVAFFLQGFFGNSQKSLTWDEPSYISAGYTYLKWNDFSLNPSHPPLMQELAALPLLFMDLNSPAKNDLSWRNNINPVVEFGRRFLFESGNDFRRITRLARLPALLLGSLLILAIYQWGSQLYGRGPALLATVFAAFCPNLLAHAKVATEDLGCSVLMFLAVWALWQSLRDNRRRDWLLCGLVTGLALLAKYTALLLGPIFVVLALGFWWGRQREIKLVELFRGGLIIFGVTALVVGAGYNFSFDYSWYWGGLKKLYTDYPEGMQYYLFGRVLDKPVWYYYLAAFLVKTPTPTLLMLGAAGACAFRQRRHDEASWFMLAPVAVVLLVTFFDKHNLGLRRILPVFPFLLLFLAGSAVDLLKRRSGSFFVAAMLGWLIFEAWSIYPHHLSYFNTIAGGSKRGPYLLDDSNIDWGQDLPALAEWQKQHYGGRPIKLFYNGTADPIAYGVNPLVMDQREILSPQPGIYAISAHYLVFFRTISANDGYDVDWLTKYKPIAYAGNSIYLYEFK